MCSWRPGGGRPVEERQLRTRWRIAALIVLAILAAILFAAGVVNVFASDGSRDLIHVWEPGRMLRFVDPYAV